MKRNGIPVYFLTLDDHYERTVWNGKTSEWAHVVAGVLQGSGLDPLMFFFYIDITVDIKSNMHIFADDVSLFHIVEGLFAYFGDLPHDLNKIYIWANQWRLTLT